MVTQKQSTDIKNLDRQYAIDYIEVMYYDKYGRVIQSVVKNDVGTTRT
jgi:hypothetical protein